MNAARKDRWIADSEEVLRQARVRLGQRADEKLLQLRIDAGQAAAWRSPVQTLAFEQGVDAVREMKSRRSTVGPGP